MDIDEARAKRNAARRLYHRANRDRINAQNKEWKERHKEQVKQASREYQTALRAQNPDHARELKRRSREKHLEKRKAENKAWLAEHPGYHARWHATNRVKNPLLYVWRNCRNRAKTLEVEFNLAIEDLVVPEFCPVLGVKLEWGRGTKTGFNAPNAPSVDRHDPSKGYTKCNIRVISNRANILKRDGTLEEFELLVRYLRGCP